MSASTNAEAFHWWKHGVIYQIYPRSFCDSSGDGNGDLKGITARLDYLADLGVDGLWLSPIFDSPMHDFGYDVRDYCAIAPVFGTLEDFDELLREAHARDIHIILDMIFNHTSSEHRWFVESRENPDSGKRDWYIRHPGRRPIFGRRPILGRRPVLGRRPRRPNNWRAAFGGSAWTWEPETGSYYLHLFLEEQPDLNWRNPEVERAMFEQARFWLERGVDGFRLDVINYIVKDRDFRSNPYRLRLTYPRRHDQQDHIYDRNQPETHDILKRFRDVLDEYGDTMLVGEVYPNQGEFQPHISAEYLGSGSDELHLAFDFSPLRVGFSAAAFRAVLERWYACIPEGGWPSHVLNNHDTSRSLTRLCNGSTDRARLLAALLLTQRGTPFIYYGEEIGMRDGRMQRAHLRDPVGRTYWPFFHGRDPVRTPMQWTDEPRAGFMPARSRTNADPWLPVNADVHAVNVSSQREDPDSLLNWYRYLIQLRRTRRELTHGSIEFLDAHPDLLVYRRVRNGSATTVILNFAAKQRPAPKLEHTAHRRSHASSGTQTEQHSRSASAGRSAPSAPLAPLEVRFLFSDDAADAPAGG